MMWIVIAGVVLGVGFFARRTIRGRRKLDRLQASAATLQAELDNPEMDEGFAHQVAADQRARDKLAVAPRSGEGAV